MGYKDSHIKVYRRIGEREETCNLGEKHRVYVYTTKILGPVVGGRVHDNGYEKNITDLRLDAQGRTYHMHVTIDFYNNVSWVRDDGAYFEVHPRRGAVDLNGNLLK